jgi:hypothetical protein
MGSNKGILGGILTNNTVLWFIVLFLLIFWRCNNYGPTSCFREDDFILAE